MLAQAVAPRRTEDERMLDRQLPAEPVARAAELGAFTHTEAWRVLRIQGEFVAGIDALAEIGAAVSVFGSARFAESHPMYATSRRLGQLLAEAGFAVITGGGPGLMEAANRGAHETGGVSIGLNIELPFEQKSNPLYQPERRLPLFLRAQDDVREVRHRLCHLSRAASARSTSCSRRSRSSRRTRSTGFRSFSLVSPTGRDFSTGSCPRCSRKGRFRART